MAGYIGSKSSVTQVDGYSEAEADAEFVTKTGDTMSGNLDVTGTVSAVQLDITENTNARLISSDAIGEVGSGTFALQVSNSAGSALKPLGFRAEDIRFATGSSERMRIDSSGRLLLGTTTSFADGNSENLQIAGSGNTGMIIKSGSANYGSIYFGDATSGGARNAGIVRYFHNDNSMQFWTNETERMRIDSSGNVLVGKTALDNNTVGIRMNATGDASFVADGNRPLVLNRKTSDGDIALFLKDGSTVGSIGVVGDSIIFGRGDTALAFNNGLDAVYPINTNGGPRDNAIDLGRSNVRFDDIYATNGTIQTSDFNEKQDIASLTATEMLVGKRISALFKTFRWKDSVAENGDNARTHTGVIAQDVQAAFTAEGLDAGNYSLFISSTWWETQTDVPAVEAVEAVDEVTETTTDEDGNEVVTVITEAVEAVEAKDAYTRTDTYDTEAEAPEGATSKTRMGIRYPELLSFVAAYNEQRFASIEARLTALEA